jgi:hypothetical protein
MTKIVFSAKLAKFGNKKGTYPDRRAIIIPVSKLEEALKKFGDSDVKVTVETL